MAQLKDLLVTGPSRLLNDLYVTTDIYEDGTALQDKYGASLSLSGYTLGLKTKNGDLLNSITIPSITYTAGDGIAISSAHAISVKTGTGLTTDGNDAIAVDTNTIATQSWVTGKGYITSSGNTWRPVKYGSTTVNDKTTTLEFVAGNVIDLTFASGKLTINHESYGDGYASGLYKVTIDSYGHIESATAVAKADITGLGIPSSDTNTTYSLAVNGTGTNANKLGLTAGGSGSGTTWVTVPYATSAGSATSATSATTASKITGNTIALDTAVTSTATTFTGASAVTIPVNSVKEAYLVWGGKNFSGSYGVIDAAMIPELGANRLAFLKAAGLTVEYSTNAGSSWTDYGLTNVQKTGIFGAGTNVYLGKHTTNGSCTVSDQLRITIDTGAASIYTVLNKFGIYMSASGATVYVKIEKALQSTPTTYIDVIDWTQISGWSGWNILNVNGFATYGNTPASQYGRVRFTFKQTAVNTKYSSASIAKIIGFGGVGWTTPSTLAKTGNIYSYDNEQNVTFPAKINGYTLAAACAKGVDTSISAGNTSTNLPTSAAVATFVEGKGYITSIPTATIQVIGGVKVPSGSGLAIGTGNSAGSLSLNVGTGLDVDNNNNLIVSLSASNIPTITSSKISDFTSAAKTAIGIASSGSTFLRKDGTWTSPTVSSIAWSSVTSKPFTSVNETGGLEVASNDLQVKAGTGLTINSDSGELEVSFGTTATTAAKGNHTHTITAAVTDGVWDLTGTNGTDKVTYAVAPYPAATATSTWIQTAANAGKFYLGTNRVPYATTRLNYNGYFYARDVYVNGSSVDSRLTSLEEQICLIEGTKIKMADGSEKNIEDVRTGDMVLSYNPAKAEQIPAMALKSVRTGVAKDFDVLVYENGNYAEMYQEHSIYDTALGYPHSHKEWNVGDEGLMVDGPSKLIRKTTSRHAIIKERFVLVTSTGLYYANGILMGIWPSTKYNITKHSCYGLNLPDAILNEFKREGELNDRSNTLEINPDFLSRSKTLQTTIYNLSKEIEDCKKNLLDTDYIVTKFTEGLISAAEWLKSKASRANWRSLINKDEGPLAEAIEQLEALKQQIKGDNPSLKDIYWESVTKANEMLPAFQEWFENWQKPEE